MSGVVFQFLSNMDELKQEGGEMEVCLVCKHGLINARDIHESRTAFSKTLLAVKLGQCLISDQKGFLFDRSNRVFALRMQEIDSLF